jgi:hypothetical protein
LKQLKLQFGNKLRRDARLGGVATKRGENAVLTAAGSALGGVKRGDRAMSKQLAHHHVNNMVRDLLSAALKGADDDDDSAAGLNAAHILEAFLNHNVTKRVLNSLKETPIGGLAGATRDIVVDAQIVERLRTSLQLLKNSTSSKNEWHAYSSILTAIAPSEVDSIDFDKVLKRLEVGSTALSKAVRRRTLIDDDDDDDAPWFQEDKKKRSDAFVIQHEQHVKTLLSFWDSNTQASANTSDLQWKHVRERSVGRATQGSLKLR